MGKIIREVLVCGKMCMPCNMVKQWLNEHNIEVEIIYGEDDMQFCRTYGICKTPTLVIMKTVPQSSYEGFEKIDDPQAIINYFEEKNK